MSNRNEKIFALAEEVLGNRKLAVRWLSKPRKRFDGLCAMEILQTDAGAILVEELLREVDSGYVD